MTPCWSRSTLAERSSSSLGPKGCLLTAIPVPAGAVSFLVVSIPLFLRAC